MADSNIAVCVLAQCEVDGDFEKFEEVGDEFFSCLTDERIEDLKLLHGIKEGWYLFISIVNVVVYVMSCAVQ